MQKMINPSRIWITKHTEATGMSSPHSVTVEKTVKTPHLPCSAANNDENLADKNPMDF